MATNPLDARSDEELMCSYQRGATPAFQVLFSRHARRVFGYFVQSTGSRALAEDLTQQTWLHVHRARATYKPTGRFAPWLYTIAANLRRDHGRARARHGDDLTADGTLPEPTVDPPEPDGRGEVVRQALLALPESYRDVILLHRWHELGFAEIAQVLGTTEGAVKLRAHRGYLRLRELLAERGLP